MRLSVFLVADMDAPHVLYFCREPILEAFLFFSRIARG